MNGMDSMDGPNGEFGGAGRWRVALDFSKDFPDWRWIRLVTTIPRPNAGLGMRTPNEMAELTRQIEAVRRWTELPAAACEHLPGCGWAQGLPLAGP